MRIRTIMAAALAALALTAVGCGGGKKGGDTTTTTEKKPEGGGTLYDRLGGKEAITAVVNEFVTIVVADDRINAFFKNADADHLKKMLVEQICDASSGGTACKYSGKDMKTAHTGMNVKDEHFNALVEDLGKAMTKLGVKEDIQKELVSALAPMHDDIVGH
ncbi:MAG: group 1 truncated hemoglobin [Kofleriaceae bacterium]